MPIRKSASPPSVAGHGPSGGRPSRLSPGLHSGLAVSAGLVLCLLRLDAGQSPAGFITELDAGRCQRVVTYGTSLTANSAWPAGLQDHLRATHGCRAKVINAAGGGRNSRWGLANLDQRVLRRRPDVVFIEFAINDALAEFRISVDESMWNLEQMISMIRQRDPNCEVIVMIMNPPTGPALGQRPRIPEFEEGHRKVARLRSCRLIDFSPSWNAIISKNPARWKSLAPDGLHPVDQACREVILPQLLKGIGFPTTVRPGRP